MSMFVDSQIDKPISLFMLGRSKLFLPVIRNYFIFNNHQPLLLESHYASIINPPNGNWRLGVASHEFKE